MSGIRNGSESRRVGLVANGPPPASAKSARSSPTDARWLLTTSDGVVVVDAPPTIGNNIQLHHTSKA